MFEKISTDASAWKKFISLFIALSLFVLGVLIFAIFFFTAGMITVLLSPILGAGLFGVCGFYGPFEYVWLDLLIVVIGITAGIWTAIMVVRKIGTRII